MLVGPGPLTAVGICIESQKRMRKSIRQTNKVVINRKKEYPKPKKYKIIRYL